MRNRPTSNVQRQPVRVCDTSEELDSGPKPRTSSVTLGARNGTYVGTVSPIAAGHDVRSRVEQREYSSPGKSTDDEDVMNRYNLNDNVVSEQKEGQNDIATSGEAPGYNSWDEDEDDDKDENKEPEKGPTASFETKDAGDKADRDKEKGARISSGKSIGGGVDKEPEEEPTVNLAETEEKDDNHRERGVDMVPGERVEVNDGKNGEGFSSDWDSDDDSDMHKKYGSDRSEGDDGEGYGPALRGRQRGERGGDEADDEESGGGGGGRGRDRRGRPKEKGLGWNLKWEKPKYGYKRGGGNWQKLKDHEFEWSDDFKKRQTLKVWERLGGENGPGKRGGGRGGRGAGRGSYTSREPGKPMVGKQVIDPRSRSVDRSAAAATGGDGGGDKQPGRYDRAKSLERGRASQEERDLKRWGYKRGDAHWKRLRDHEFDWSDDFRKRQTLSVFDRLKGGTKTMEPVQDPGTEIKTAGGTGVTNINAKPRVDTWRGARPRKIGAKKTAGSDVAE